jgi:copper transport protein
VVAALARPAYGTRSVPQATNRLGRAVRAEAGGLVGVLAVTAVLVSVAPAGPASTEPAAPLSLIVPGVPVGTLTGQITVNATASAGQLVIRMSSPGRDDLGTDFSELRSVVMYQAGLR